MSGENKGKKVVITWNYRCQQSFDDLSHLCTIAPILAYANFMKPFKLHTNACRCGLGAVLYQTHGDGTDVVIAYASTSLTKTETHYPAHKLDFSPLNGLWLRKSMIIFMG